MTPILHQFDAPNPMDPETGVSEGFHKVAYTEWGDKENPDILVCVHGLTRNSRDFDYLAGAMKDKYRIFCLDVAGRGRSEWLKRKEHYSYATYVADMLSFTQHIKAEKIDWVGTSMGGLIGMIIAAYHPQLIRKMVLNDIGPFIPAHTLKRIAKYVGIMPEFNDLQAVEKHLRLILAPFGIQKDEDWNFIARHSTLEKEGKITLAYDPAIAHVFGGEGGDIQDVNLWYIWEQVTCPILVLRGALSDALLSETTKQMAETGPKAKVVEIPGIGHAPALMDEEQISIIRDWLMKDA
jgi:pimeloyl-ACP methyl ester carboxylesterase